MWSKSDSSKGHKENEDRKGVKDGGSGGVGRSRGYTGQLETSAEPGPLAYSSRGGTRLQEKGAAGANVLR